MSQSASEPVAIASDDVAWRPGPTGTLNAPPASRKAIVRRRLLDRLSSARVACVALIAPSGFGKTTLLAGWAKDDPGDHVWITLMERHDDPVLLVGQIAAAFDATEPLGSEVFAPLSGPSPDVETYVVPRLCEALGRRSRPVVLFLDDVHTISDPDALACISALVDQFPDGSRMLMASRSEPEIGFGQLRVHGRLDEIRAGAMAMTRIEAGQVLAAAGRQLPDELVGQLVERTEGWPAALYLATLALEGEDSPEQVIDHFHGDERLVADYMRDRFLRPLDPEVVDFLTRASLLGVLSGDLCDAALQRSGSANELRSLSRSNMLLAPLDTKDNEFRMHALLREMLQAELHRLHADEETELHRRASDWYRSRGDVDHSVEHAIASGDVDLSGERIWGAAVAYVTEGRRSTLRSWTGSFTEDQLASVPTLSMTMALLALSAGDGGEMRHWVEIAAEGMADLPDPPDPSLVACAEIVRLSANVPDGLAEVANRFDALHRIFPQGSPWRSYSRFVEGVIHHLLGDRSRARALLEEGGSLRSPPVVQTHCHGQLALIALDEGRSSDAELAAKEAVSKVRLFGLDAYSASALPFGVMALIRARRGDGSEAAKLLASAEALADAGPVANDWFTAEILTLMARAHIGLGDLARARARLEEADRLREAFPEAVVLDEWTSAIRDVLDAGSGADGRSLLTPAELRLLHLMPTHLSYREIADELVVSPNTVKTQSKSIYRKLGANSRSEAVKAGKLAGLLSRNDDL